MNSTGRELSQADLIRNFILMGLEHVGRRSSTEDHWRPMEVDVRPGSVRHPVRRFMRHYLTVKTGEIPNVRAVYEAFKAYHARAEVESAGIEALVADHPRLRRLLLRDGARARSRTRPRRAFHDLRELKVDVAYPFLLELYHDYKQGELSPGTSCRWCGWSRRTFSGERYARSRRTP